MYSQFPWALLSSFPLHFALNFGCHIVKVIHGTPKILDGFQNKCSAVCVIEDTVLKYFNFNWPYLGVLSMISVSVIPVICYLLCLYSLTKFWEIRVVVWSLLLVWYETETALHHISWKHNLKWKAKDWLRLDGYASHMKRQWIRTCFPGTWYRDTFSFTDPFFHQTFCTGTDFFLVMLFETRNS